MQVFIRHFSSVRKTRKQLNQLKIKIFLWLSVTVGFCPNRSTYRSTVLERGRCGIMRMWLSQCYPVLFQKGGKDLPALANRGLGFCWLLRQFSHFHKCVNNNVSNELSKKIVIFASDLTSFKKERCIKIVEILE